MATFKIGDRVEIYRLGHASKVWLPVLHTPTVILRGTDETGWELDLESPVHPGYTVRAQESVLRHIDDKYDGDEKTTWDELDDLWSPQVLERVEDKQSRIKN